MNKCLLGLGALGALGLFSANANADWGNWPECDAPAVPFEVHSWWHEPGEDVPRHVHLATCLPHARDMDGTVSFSGATLYPVKVTAFNQPGRLNFVRNGWQAGTDGLLTHIGTNEICQSGPDLLQECTYWYNLLIDADQAVASGLQELRQTPDVRHADLGTRQFATLNYQIHTDNGKPLNHYRNNPTPIARSWYTDFGYANVEISNYMDLFTDLNQTIPTVSGVVPLNIKHAQGNHTITSYLFLNPDFHANPHHHDNPPPGMLLYKKPGRFNGTYEWDTTGLADGVHALYLQTEDKHSSGINAGALKIFFNVQNGNGNGNGGDPGNGNGDDCTCP